MARALHSLGFSGRDSEEDCLFLLLREELHWDEGGRRIKKVGHWDEEGSGAEGGEKKQQNPVLLKVA